MWADRPDRLVNAIWASYIMGDPLLAHDELPSSAQLQREFGCSRVALTNALAQLAERKMISRQAQNRSWHIQHGLPLFEDVPLLGVVIPLFTHDVLKHMVDGLQSTVDQLGAQLIPMQHEMGVSQEQQCVEDLVNAGCKSLMIYPAYRSAKPKGSDYLATNHYDLPIVLADIGFHEHKYPMVGVDNYQLGYDVTRTLIQMGHTRIAFMSFANSPDITPNRIVNTRYRGYLNALSDASLSVRSDSLLVVNPITTEGVREPISEYLRKWNTGHLGATAMICFDDQFAQFVLQVANELGIRLNGRLALAGFDNLKGLREIPLVLSTNNDFFMLGRIAARLALYGIRYGHYTIPSEVIIRQEAD